MSYYAQIANVTPKIKKKLGLEIQDLTPIGKLMYLKSKLLTLTKEPMLGMYLRDRVELMTTIRICKELINELDQNAK